MASADLTLTVDHQTKPRGWLTSEHALAWASFIVSAALLWKWGPQMWHGAAVIASIAVGYAGCRSWVKRPAFPFFSRKQS